MVSMLLEEEFGLLMVGSKILHWIKSGLKPGSQLLLSILSGKHILYSWTIVFEAICPFFATALVYDGIKGETSQSI